MYARGHSLKLDQMMIFKSGGEQRWHFKTIIE